MILETKRLLLRAFTPDDLEALAPILAKNEVMEFSLSGPLSHEQTKAYLHNRILAHYAEHEFGLWAILYEGTLIGFAGLIMQTLDGIPYVELAYRLDPQYWGQGFATEAARAIIGLAKSRWHLSSLISIIDPKNVKSAAVAARLGMQPWKEAVFHGFSVTIFRLDLAK